MGADGTGTGSGSDESGTVPSNGDGGVDAAGSGGRPCPLCERPMTHRHCKYVCPEHGVVYDCADTFY